MQFKTHDSSLLNGLKFLATEHPWAQKGAIVHPSIVGQMCLYFQEYWAGFCSKSAWYTWIYRSLCVDMCSCYYLYLPLLVNCNQNFRDRERSQKKEILLKVLLRRWLHSKFVPAWTWGIIMGILPWATNQWDTRHPWFLCSQIYVYPPLLLWAVTTFCCHQDICFAYADLGVLLHF